MIQKKGEQLNIRERPRVIMDPMRIELSGYAVLEKIATKQGNSAHVTVPLAWLGKRVRVVLVDPLDRPE